MQSKDLKANFHFKNSSLEISLKNQRRQLCKMDKIEELLKENKKLRERLRESSEDNRRLNSMVSHELKTPLQVMLWIAYDLKKNAKKRANETPRKYAERLEGKVLEHSRKIQKIVGHSNDITYLLTLDGMTRKQLMKGSKELDLEKTLEGIASSYDKYLRKKRIKLVTHYDTPEGEPPTIYGNPGVFSALIGTLSGNATSHAPEDSIIKEGIWISSNNFHYFLENEKGGGRDRDSPGNGMGEGLTYVEKITHALGGKVQPHHTPKFHKHKYTRSTTYGYKSGPDEFNGDGEIHSVEIMIPMSVLTPPKHD